MLDITLFLLITDIHNGMYSNNFNFTRQVATHGDNNKEHKETPREEHILMLVKINTNTISNPTTVQYRHGSPLRVLWPCPGLSQAIMISCVD
jgi:hypothetical protein